MKIITGKDIRRIIKEESEIKEKGIEISRLQKLQPKNYLAKRIKSVEKESKKFPKASEIESQFLSIIDSIKNMNWSDIILEENDSAHSFDVHLPKKIEKGLSSVYKKLDRLEYDYIKRLDQRVRDFYDEYSGFERNPPQINYESGRNRTHFPDGLPGWLKNLGLGLKIYRRVLNELGHIVSEDNASAGVQKIYADLIQFSDVNCVLIKDGTLVIEKDLDVKTKQKIVAEYIYEQYIEYNFPKLKLNKSIVFDSALLSELGKSKVEDLNERLYKFYKRRPSRRSWEDSSSFEDYKEYQDDYKEE